MAVIVVVALPLMPLLRELKAIKWPAYLAWHSQIHFFITGGFLCGVTYFEYAIQQRFRLAPAVVLHLLFKLVMGDSFLDISAVFLAYATASPAVASTASVEAVLPILTILALLGVIFILALAWRKVKLSIHYNARVLRLLKYRHELEVAVTKHIIGKNMVSSPLDLKHIDSSQSSQGMFREAVREGIFATPHDFSDLNVSRRGAERHLTAMIAVMQCFTGEHDSIQNIRNRAYIHKFLDELAKIHKITPVRKFRGLWIGSLGFFDTWEQSRLNSCHVVQMASEITLLSRRFGWQLCTAIDQGSIIGGYIGEQMNFDILGSEVQWVMSTVDEVHAPHEICISAAVRAALMSDSVAKSGIFSVDVTFRTIRTRMSEAETVYVIDNAPDLVKLTLEEIVSIYSKVSLLDEVPIDWDHVQRIWKSDALGFFNQGKQWEQLGAFAEAPLDESDDLSGSDFTTPSSNMNNNQSYRYDGSTSASMSSVALYGKSRKLDIRRSLNTRSESNLSDDRSEAGDLDSHDGDIRSHAARIQGKESQNNSAFRPVNPELDADPGGGKLKDSFKKKRRRSSFFGNPNEFLSSFLSPSATDMDMLDRMEEIYFFKAQDKGRDTDFYLRNKCSLMTDTSSILHPHEITLAAGVLTFKYYFKEIMQIDSLMEIVEGFWQELRDFALGEEDLHAINRNFYFSETLPNPIQVLITLSKELPLVGLNFLFNTGVMSWHILFYLLMNEPFDFYNYPLLLKIVSVISGFTEKLIKSKVHPTDMASEGHLVGNISEFDDRISDIEHTFESPNLALSNNLQTVGNISAARMWEPSSRNPKKSEAYKLANDSKPLWGYCRNVRKNIGLNMIYVMWLLSLSTVILATHAKINSVGSKNAGAFSFQYLGIIYMICILLMYEHAMESKIVYFIGLVAKLVLVLVFPLYLETLDDNHATAFAEIVVSHQTRHVNALYLVFVHLLLGSFVRPLRYAYLECVVIVSGIMLRYLILDGHEQKHFDIEDRIQLLSFFVAFMLIANILLEYYITLCYVLETLLSPHATAAMLHQHEMTRSVISIFMPSVSPEVGIKFMNMKRYGNCSVITMHVKPYQTLPSLVSEKEAAAFLLLFHRMLDACFTECGFVRLCRFSGVFVAVTSDDADFGQNLSKLRQNVSCRRRALLCAKFVQKRLEAFNRTYKVNTAVGVSIMSGALSLGVIDANDITLSVCGNIVSIGSMLAVREADSIVVDDSFATEAKKMVNKRFTILLPGYVAPSKFYSLVLDEGSFGGQGRKLNDFTYIAMLGRGGYGSVHLVTMNQYNIKYAIKCIPKRKGGAASDVMITREFLILTQMKHPNVMALKYCIMSESCVYLVMEYVRGGNLKQIIEKYDPELSTLKLWFAELILAIEYVHSLGIQHRDVKPVNCMIHTDGHLKLGDFGLAKIVGDDLNSSTIRDTDVITDNSDSSDSYGDQMIKALTIMQKVLPIRHHTTHVEGGAQLSGLIQAIVFDTDIGRGQQTCVVLRNMMIEATFQETSKDMWKLLDDPQSSVDLILIDLGSDLDGPDWALFNELRARSNSESIPRIVLSAFDYKDLEDKAIALGAKMFILHPLDVHVHRYCFSFMSIYNLKQ